MSTFRPLKTSLMVACLLAFSSSFATSGTATGTGTTAGTTSGAGTTAATAPKMSSEEVKAARDQIKATAKSDKEACDKLKDNAKDVCNKEATAKEKVALAELDYKRSGKDADRIKAARVKAEQEYEVAKEKCDDKSGADKDACQKEAKAAEAKAKADLKAESKVANKG
jgi:hypothetical protein